MSQTGAVTVNFPDVKHVLVTGATGFIGKTLVLRLQREGFRVHVLTRDPSSAKKLFSSGVEIHRWNTIDEEYLSEEISAVIHLAGQSLAQWPWNEKRKEQLLRSRIAPTRQLVEAVGRMKTKPSVLISASGMGYYGDTGDRPVRVGDSAGDDFLGHMAAAWEGEALLAKNFGTRVVLPRFGMVIGPNGGILSRMSLPFRLGLGAILGSGKQYWNWIHLDDVIELLIESISNSNLEGPINAVAGTPLTQKEFSKILARKLHRHLLFHIPASILRLALGEMADLLLHGQKAEPDPVRFNPRISSLEEALKRSLE